MMTFCNLRRMVRLAAIQAVAAFIVWQAPLLGSAQAQSGLADLYRRDAGIGSRSVERYLFNRHFYHRPSVHPALNLDRPDPFGSTAFHAHVRPEQERRERAAQAQREYRARRAQGRANHGPAGGQGSDRFMNTGDRFGTR